MKNFHQALKKLAKRGQREIINDVVSHLHSSRLPQ